jgi:hypothetical protein
MTFAGEPHVARAAAPRPLRHHARRVAAEVRRQRLAGAPARRHERAVGQARQVDRVVRAHEAATKADVGRWKISSGAPYCTTRPASSTAMRSAERQASSRSCVTYTA